jgi:hypothetical protein
LIGERDELFGQGIKPTEVFHMLFDLAGVLGGNPLGALPPFEGGLQDEVRTRLDDLALPAGLEELAAEGAAPQVVDLLHAIENGIALGTEGNNGIRHGHLYPRRYNLATKKQARIKAHHLRSLFCHTPQITGYWWTNWELFPSFIIVSEAYGSRPETSIHNSCPEAFLQANRAGHDYPQPETQTP